MRNILAATVFLYLTVSPLNAGEGQWGDLLRGGGVVVDHQPHPFGGLASDTSLRSLPIPQLPEIWQWVADDFTSPVDATVRGVNFWGFYNEDVQPVADETFRIRFYEPRMSDGLPGAILYEASFLNPTNNATGVLIPDFGAPEEFFYRVDLSTPFLVAANTPYWLEVVQVGDVDAAFRWEFSRNSETNGQAFVNEDIGGDWEHSDPISSDTAFQLSTVPEPQAAVLVLSACVLLRRRNGRCR